MELTKNNSAHSQESYNLGKKKNSKVTYLNWEANRKEHTEEALYNLSYENVYLLFLSFCRFHETCGLN